MVECQLPKLDTRVRFPSPAHPLIDDMLHEEKDLDFVRHATAELAVSFTDPRDHNLHAAFNGLIEAIRADRARLAKLEAEVQSLRAQLVNPT
jgi:hypothetical protein